jgi:hypothetical protein
MMKKDATIPVIRPERTSQKTGIPEDGWAGKAG